MSINDIYFSIFIPSQKDFTLNRIKQVLAEKKISQTQLSQKIDKSFESVNAYVQNRRQPSIELLYKIAEALDTSITNLLKDNKSAE